MTGLEPAIEYHVVNSLGWPDLRPLQKAAVGPIREGADCLLLAPTAGGKTEAAFFPILSEMVFGQWDGLSVLYVTPLRALLNNLQPRLHGYAQWVGRRTELWHGDVGPTQRRRILADLPDVLLTTPESLEAMLVSTRVDHRFLFAGVRAVVVDELHAFAGDDRGWHLQAVLERVQRLAGRRLQRVGLSATVGNPGELLGWLGGGTPAAQARVVSPPTGEPVVPEIGVDYVGSVANAATVIAALHHGEKRLAFCESRAQTEDLAQELRDRGVTTFVSHSSLSADERRRSEQAFAEARDCVVVATSTLELGIDVGDLDRVIQLDSPRTVASFLQRLGRTGRRPGTERNTLFLCTREDSLLQAAGLLQLWSTGFVEPVVPPPKPWHIVAQQLLALALQEGAIGLTTWREWWPGLSMMDDGETILDHLVREGFLATDGGLAFVGDAADRAFGRRNFMDLTAVFTADPELRVMHGRRDLGSVSPLSLVDRPAVLGLAGKAWRVTHVDWKRRTVSVVEEAGRGASRWSSVGLGRGLSKELAQGMRAVLLGEDPPVTLSRRAVGMLARLRQEWSGRVAEGAVVLEAGETLWTFAGDAANRSLAAALDRLGIDARADSLAVRCEVPITVGQVRDAGMLLGGDDPPEPRVDARLQEGLKFSAALPEEMARRELQARAGDVEGAVQSVVVRMSFT